MSEYLNFVDEIAKIDAGNFVLGEYLYLGQMKTAEGKTVVLSVGYKPNYALIRECYLRKIRVGETDDCGKIMLPLEMLGQ